MISYTGERMIPELSPCRPGTLIHETHTARYRFALPYVEGKVALDIACGVGYGSAMLATHGADLVLGGDISSDAIRHAIANYNVDKTCYLRVSAHHLPFAAESIDVAISFETIEHLTQPHHFLHELRRVLHPRGCAIISTPNRDTYGTGKHVPDNEFHTQEYGLDEFAALLTRFFPRVELFAQRRLVRRSWLRIQLDRLARRVRIADRLGLRRMVPATLRSMFGRSTDAYETECRVRPLMTTDKPLFFVAVVHVSAD